MLHRRIRVIRHRGLGAVADPTGGEKLDVKHAYFDNSPHIPATQVETALGVRHWLRLLEPKRRTDSGNMVNSF